MTVEQLGGVLFAGTLGAVLGSFANVLILRWHEDASILGRSHCPQCQRVIRPRHLVPILSWLWLGGKCADCGKSIHIQYPLVEAACALLGVVAALRAQPFGGHAIQFWFEFILSIGLVVPIVMDLRWKELPVEYLAGLALIAYGFQPALFASGLSEFQGHNGWIASWVYPWFAVSIPVAFFGIQYLVSRGKWIGLGDLWFGAVMGMALGSLWRVSLGLYLAYVIGGIVAVLGMIMGMVKRGGRLPFAPMLAAGTMMTIWYGDAILAFIRGS